MSPRESGLESDISGLIFSHCQAGKLPLLPLNSAGTSLCPPKTLLPKLRDFKARKKLARLKKYFHIQLTEFRCSERRNSRPSVPPSLS